MNILEKITAVKRIEVKERKRINPVSELEKSAFFKLQMPSFYKVLAKPGPSIIGEFKRKSPSKGAINLTADIHQVAMGYQNAGIDAMSVLTDEDFFGGKNDDLLTVAGFLNIPLLRKDFIVDEYQVVEAKAIGACAILLIASILNKSEVEMLSQLALSFGMDILFEIHDIKDLDKLNNNIRIIGVNNRNLKTFEINLNNSADLMRHLPQNCLKVAESGFQTADDVKQLFTIGYDAFLIGENFMKADNPGIAAATFINEIKLLTV